MGNPTKKMPAPRLLLTVVASTMALVALVAIMSTNTSETAPSSVVPSSNLDTKHTESTTTSLELTLEDSMAPTTKMGLKKLVKKTVKSISNAFTSTISVANDMVQDSVTCVARTWNEVVSETCDIADTLSDLPGLIDEAGNQLVDQTLNGLTKLKDLAEDGWDQLVDMFNDIEIDVVCGYSTEITTSAAAQLVCTVKNIPELSPVVMTADISTADFNIDMTIEAAGHKIGPFALLSLACIKQPNIPGVGTPQIALCFTLDNAVWHNSDGSVANPLSGEIGMYVKALSGTGLNAELYADDTIAKYSISTAAGAASNPLPLGGDCQGGLLTCDSGTSCQDRRRRRRQPFVCTADLIPEGGSCSTTSTEQYCATGTSCQDRRRRRRQPFVCTSDRI